MTYKAFIQKWGNAEYPPAPISSREIESVEAALSCRLPSSLRSALIEHGVASVEIALLDEISEQEIDLADVQEFLHPDDMREVTLQWRENGLPQDAVAFAMDCMGNLFCFCSAGNDPICLWDHEENKVRQVASSFDEWIAMYCELGEPS